MDDTGAGRWRWRRWQRWRRWWLCAASGVLAVGLAAVAGCAHELEGGLGADDLPEVPDAPEEAEALLLDAAERTSAAGSVDASMTADLVLAGLDVDYDWTADGVGEIDGTTRGLGGVVTFEIRSDGTTAWTRSDDPDVLALLAPGATWIEGPRDEILTGTRAVIDGLWQYFLFLRGAASIDAGGIESVEGVPVRMVSGTIDRDAAYAASTTTEQEVMDEAYHSSATDERFEFELGIDRDRRIRSLDYTITQLGEDAFGTPMRLHIEVRRFDQEVETPEPPPAGETVSVDDIPGGIEALNDDD